MPAVFFDMDGVLVDSYEAWFYVLVAAAGDFGTPEITREAYDASWGQGIDADVQTFFAGRTRAEVESYYSEHFADHAHHVRVNPDAAPVLSSLRERGVRTAVITNTPATIAKATLEPVGITADLLVGAGGEIQPKPAPDMLVHACEQLEVSRTDALMVGDSRFDQGAARAAGVRFVGYGGIEGDETIARLTDVLALI